MSPECYSQLKCYFCHRELEKDTIVTYRCKVCLGYVQYFYHQDPTKLPNSLWCIQMQALGDNWDALSRPLFQLYPCEPKFKAYIGDSNNPLIELDYLPDITPDNALEWVERFTNLKSFT